MSQRLLSILLSLLSLPVSVVVNFDVSMADRSRNMAAMHGTDQVLSIIKSNVPVNLAVIAAPTPCAIVSYASCNYLIPSNDYVTFDLATDIAFTTCTTGQLNTATITFAAAPSVPLFVWLSYTTGGTTTSTTPVYMTGASETINKAWFGAGATSWFSGGPWTTLNVQAIYPTPPPSTLYYPISCTIVYQ